jgi:hypothetical protein
MTSEREKKKAEKEKLAIDKEDAELIYRATTVALSNLQDELNACKKNADTYRKRWKAEKEKLDVAEEALNKYCALPLPLDEMPNMTIKDALEIFAIRIGVAREALSKIKKR